MSSLLGGAGRGNDVDQLLPAVPRDATREAAEQEREHPHPPLDLHEVLQGAALGHATHRSDLLHLRHGGHADDGPHCHPGNRWDCLTRLCSRFLHII
jgi:hypothetical protein